MDTCQFVILGRQGVPADHAIKQRCHLVCIEYCQGVAPSSLFVITTSLTPDFRNTQMTS
jgi:hypothetical protein